MFIVSLSKVKIFAAVGLFPQEHILGNHFEVDIDVYTEVSSYDDGCFVDYSVLNTIIQNAFGPEVQTLEGIAQKIHKAAFATFPFVEKISVSLRKMNPPMQGDMAYAQVMYSD